MLDINQLASELLLLLTEKEKNEDLDIVLFFREKSTLNPSSTTLNKTEIDELTEKITKHKEITFQDKLNEFWIAREKFLETKDKNFEGLTQTAVAELAGITKQALSKILSFRGNTIPKKSTVLRIALALELSYRDVVELLAYGNYAFNSGNRNDVILIYFFQKCVYDYRTIYSILEKISKASGINYLKSFQEEMEN